MGLSSYKDKTRVIWEPERRGSSVVRQVAFLKDLVPSTHWVTRDSKPWMTRALGI